MNSPSTSLVDVANWPQSASTRVGGNRIDEAIAAYINRKYNLIVGDRTAEEIKIAIGSALPLEQELSMEVRGRDKVAVPQQKHHTTLLTSGGRNIVGACITEQTTSPAPASPVQPSSSLCALLAD